MYQDLQNTILYDFRFFQINSQANPLRTALKKKKKQSGMSIKGSDSLTENTAH